VTGGVVVSFDSVMVPQRAELLETASTITVTLYAERPSRARFGRRAHREVFIPLNGPMSCRELIDGSYLANVRRDAA